MAFLLLVMVLRVRMLMERSTGLSKTGMKNLYTCIFVYSDQTLILSLFKKITLYFSFNLAGARTGVTKDISTWQKTDTTTAVSLQPLATHLFRTTSSLKKQYQSGSLKSIVVKKVT